MTRLALPLVLSQLAVIAIQTTDTLFMGRLGVDALAAGGLAGALYFVFYLGGLGVVTAVALLAAQAHGAGRHGDVGRVTRQGLVVAAVMGVPAALLLWQVQPILLALGQEAAIAALAEDYMRALVWGLVPSLWVIAFRAFVTALGRPKVVLFVTLAAVALNALGDYALMFGRLGMPAMGLAGAGWASALVYWFMFASLAVVVSTDREFRAYAVLVRPWRAEARRLGRIFSIGLPIGGFILLEVGIFAGASMLMGLFGATELAAHQIAFQSVAVAFMVPLGIGQAAVARVGRHAGAGDAAGVGRAGWTALMMGAAFSVPRALVFWFLPDQIVALYLDPAVPANRAVAAFAASYLAIAALFQLFDGGQAIAANALRGLSDTRAPMFMAGVGYWLVGFPASVGLGFWAGLGGVGVWSGLALGLAAAAALLTWRFARRHRLEPIDAGAP